MTDVKNFGLAGIGADVQFGKSGVRVISNAGVLTVTSPLIASAPATGAQVTTRTFVEANTMGRKTITVNEGTAATFGNVNGTVVRFTISINSPFSNGISIGTTTSSFVTDSDVDSAAEGVYEIVAVLPVNEEVQVYQTGTGTGNATIILEYWPN